MHIVISLANLLGEKGGGGVILIFYMAFQNSLF
jgi:hypothetical protein